MVAGMRRALGTKLRHRHQIGLVMAVEQWLVMGVALTGLFVRASSESERAQQRRERYETV